MAPATSSLPRRRRGAGRVTLADVASAAGVSSITVSRVLNDPGKVSADLRDRIVAAIAELGYVPNGAARALASARPLLVAVLVPSLTNEVFVETLRGIREVLQPKGYQILIGDTGYDADDEARMLDTYLAFGPGGLLLTGLQQTEAVKLRLETLRLPRVHMMELPAPNQPAPPTVGFSQTAAATAMADYLIGRNYRRIGFLATQLDHRTLLRRDGWRASMQAHGLYNTDLEITDPGRSSVGRGGELLTQILASGMKLDALFCNNDDVAQGVVFEAQRRGMDVPKDLAVVGFNDLAASAWINPGLTTIATPRYEVGREAALRLLELMGGGSAPAPLDLGFRLVTRGSA
ncbi:LacI family DNA-binding transcriptional regulator [Lacibacterium aquatile]|uniref:LacI family DNA-binding transcriptional regulator n=1 Tax=Lacibacterium aquatile TaxID=1168082 RepID=A0ABW5DMS3_9PROT